ncbi:hypothetical protein [Mesobacterium pallidum]|uniref:hypothetical protein n=1 Tax=Mesobacterium pallidum TaxID=2872037 RepID=UPI001EE32C87|nr:hypothetical protein [Mesobacterium pallidum]
MIRAALLIALSLTSPALAEVPRILAVDVSHPGMGWRFDVTLEHPDTGWDHYADGWEILDAKGKVLGTRKLAHPHVTEQPFTRSLSRVMLPDGLREIYIRARCSSQGWATKPYRVRLDPSVD